MLNVVLVMIAMEYMLCIYVYSYIYPLYLTSLHWTNSYIAQSLAGICTFEKVFKTAANLIKSDDGYTTFIFSLNCETFVTGRMIFHVSPSVSVAVNLNSVCYDSI